MASKGWKVEVAGKALACHHCGHDGFGRGAGLSVGLTFPPGAEFTCGHCGFLHTFTKHSDVRTERAD